MMKYRLLIVDDEELIRRGLCARINSFGLSDLEIDEADSGGAALAGESSRQAMARELFEETGIRADASEFEYLESGMDRNFHYDYYCLKRNTPVQEIVLLPGETDGVKWVSYDQVHEMIRRREICKIIAGQFQRQEKYLRQRDTAE